MHIVIGEHGGPVTKLEDETAGPAVRHKEAAPHHQRGNAHLGNPALPPRAATIVPMPIIHDRDIGDGRNSKALAWRNARHADFVATFVDTAPELAAEVARYQAALAPANIPPETDYRGARLVAGRSWSLVHPDGTEEVLVPESLVPAGRSIAELELSPDGRFVAFSTASTGDDRIWNVLDRRSRTPVLAPITFNSFGNNLRFASDSRGIYYPNQLATGLKVRPEVMFQSLDHVGSGVPPAKAVMAFKGASSLAHFAYPLTPAEVLIAASIASPNPGFLLFNTLLTRAADGTFSADQGNVLPSGDVGRIVSASADSIIYQTPGVFGTHALTNVDPRTGAVTELVPSRADAVMHTAQRVGDKILSWYLSDDQRWSLTIFSLDGDVRKTIHPHQLDMPDWCSPSLTFTGSIDSREFTDFIVSATLKSPRTYRLHLDTLEVEKRYSGKEVDIDPAKVTAEHGVFTARDGTKIPYHLFIPKDVPANEPKRAMSESYGSIGVILSRGWNTINQTHLATGFAVLEVGARGGGERGAPWRTAGAKDRFLTINDQSDAGYFLRQRGFVVRIGYGRSWGGWKEENGAVRDPEAFTHRVSVVSAGNAQRLVVQSPEIWSAGDFGAGMDPNGAWDDLDEAFAQARRTSTPQLFERADKLPSMLFVVQNQDGRVEPGSSQLCFNILERRFGQRNRRFGMIAVDGGHSANAHRGLLPSWYHGQLGSSVVLRSQLTTG